MSDLVKELLATHPFLSARPSADMPAVNCPAEHLPALLPWLRDQAGFDFLCDLTAIDDDSGPPRFTVVYHLYSTGQPRYLRVAAACADAAAPVMPSASAIWATANWHERETYDMFGIRFAGHPDLRRILMWDGYPYHPLRKEFPLAGHDVELPVPDLVAHTGITAAPAPMMGGPFHAGQGGPMSAREPHADDETWTESKPRQPLAGDDNR
jgi:NADH-quinone oxidoreductase subunit C